MMLPTRSWPSFRFMAAVVGVWLCHSNTRSSSSSGGGGGNNLHDGFFRTAAAFSTPNPHSGGRGTKPQQEERYTTIPVSELLRTHQSNIQRLQQQQQMISTDGSSINSELPYSNPVFFLRYCLDHDGDPTAQDEALQTTIQWRWGDGKSICQAAVRAVQEAMTITPTPQATDNPSRSDYDWRNSPVMAYAPHGDVIIPLLRNKVITTTTSRGDLIYCIRAGQINDQELMERVSVEQLTEFFLYVKEVQHLVANERSMQTDRLIQVLTANDLTGIKLVGGSGDFRRALSASSKQATLIYPTSYTGPTLLVNLPPLLNALVKLFTPLFPPAVNQRIRFQQGLLRGVDDLQQLSSPVFSEERRLFLQQLDQTVYNYSSK